MMQETATAASWHFITATVPKPVAFLKPLHSFSPSLSIWTFLVFKHLHTLYFNVAQQILTDTLKPLKVIVLRPLSRVSTTLCECT